MTKPRKPKEPPKMTIGRFLGLAIKLLATGKELLVAAASLAAALIAMSGSCNNLKRADVSYVELAKKVNGISERLDAIEDSLQDLKGPVQQHLVAEPPPPEPSDPVAASPKVHVYPMTMELKGMPRRAPLPETLDMLMMQHQEALAAPMIVSPLEKK
jgi:hypothetical protein